MAERDLIRWIARRALLQPTSLVRGIGDDCAVIAGAHGQSLLVSTDTLTQGVHFFAEHHPPALLGRKAAAVSISDVNAMGGRAEYAFLAVAIPPEKNSSWVEALLEGCVRKLDEAGCCLAGGDTVSSGSGLTVTMTVLGHVADDRVVYRSGSRPGDLVWVSNTVGNAAAGLFLLSEGHAPYDPGKTPWRDLVTAHLAPEPPLTLGPCLAASGGLHAMIDLSDGIATDLAHLADAASVGAEVDAAALPLSDELLRAARQFGRDPVSWAVCGGEDFELLFTTPEMEPQGRSAFAASVRAETGCRITVVGRIREERGVSLLQDGRRREISYQGYEHRLQDTVAGAPPLST